MREKNYGICILRLLFTFQVAMGHAHAGKFFDWLGIAVPFFMLCSFYLTFTTFVHPDITRIKRRCFRICVPFVGYAIISYTVISLFNILRKKTIVPINDLMWQLFLGGSPRLDPSLWFLPDLILCSFIIFFISTCFSNKKIIICAVLVGSFLFQYTGLNYLLFSDLRYEVKYPLGRLIEMLPYACAGMLLAYSKILEKNKNNILFVIMLTVLILFARNHSIPNPHGFLYQGLNEFINTIFIFSLFYVISFYNLNNRIKQIILYISRYSLGIYCIHYIIINITRGSILSYSEESLLRGLIVYTISLFIAMLISKIPSKWAMALVE